MKPRLNLNGVILTVFTLFVFISGKTWKEDLTLTSTEKKILDQFKETVKHRLPHDYMKEDVYLFRWLRARFWRTKDAEKMLMDHLKWRQEAKMDNIFEEDWADMNKEYKYYLESRDKEGKPVLYVAVKEWDLRKVSVAGRQARFQRYIDKSLEEACGLVRELGQKYKNVTQGILLLNVDGFNLIQHGCLACVPTFLRIVVTYETHFPGCADKIIVVNFPQAAEPILIAARALFHPDTNRSLQVYGTNKVQYLAALRKYFDDDQIPIDLGGKKIYNGTLENDD